MTKANIVQAVHDRVRRMTKREAAQLVDDVFEILKETLASGENVKFSGFGSHAARQARTARSQPADGAVLKIEARRVVTFHASDVLKGAVNREAGVRVGDESTEPGRQSPRR